MDLKSRKTCLPTAIHNRKDRQTSSYWGTDHPVAPQSEAGRAEPVHLAWRQHKGVTRSWQCPSWDCRATQKLSFVWALLLLLLGLQEKVSIQGSKEGGTGESPAAFQWPGWSCTMHSSEATVPTS